MHLPAALALAFAAGKLMTKIKIPAILGWLIVGILFGPTLLGCFRRMFSAQAGSGHRSQKGFELAGEIKKDRKASSENNNA